VDHSRATTTLIRCDIPPKYIEVGAQPSDDLALPPTFANQKRRVPKVENGVVAARARGVRFWNPRASSKPTTERILAKKCHAKTIMCAIILAGS
jgi:hypothetical protein